ncbi:MAG: undecaprenyl-diphosphate phosphatase [Coriobacteriales bacterium]|nr:undecaprenyl-diphosphate phosphatase [Coriobacteriales bacterium]
MNFFQAVLLGIIQGLTEFLPISSDGHLALASKLFGLTESIGAESMLTFAIFLHFPTLLAIFAFFWRDIVALASSLLPKHRDRKADRRLVLVIVIGTIATGIIALLLEDFVAPASGSYSAIGFGFLLTTLRLALGEGLSRAATRSTHLLDLPDGDGPDVEHAASGLELWKSLPLGIAQGLAVMPGVSRSGSTIAAGMLSGLKREDAARFSFLLGIPIITLATLKDGVDVVTGSAVLPPWPIALAGFIAAGASGYFAIWWLLKLVKNHSLYWFAAYTGLLGTAILVLGILGWG